MNQSTSQARQDRDVRPFAYGALAYYEGNIGMPVPLSIGQKQYPPEGFTGREGRDPTLERVYEWVGDRPTHNIGLRLQPEVLGIDIDERDGKHGAASIAAIEATHRQLPPTWKSTRRGADDPGGVFLFVINGLAAIDMREARAGDGVELIRWNHRYVVVAPSRIGADGLTYAWFAPNGMQSDRAPEFDELPELPAGWVDHLLGKCACFAIPPEEMARRERSRRRIARMPMSGLRRGALTILQGKAVRLANTPPDTDRNIRLNDYAFDCLVNFVLHEGSLTFDEVIDTLEAAALDAGLEPHEIDATLQSAWYGAEREAGGRRRG